MVEGNRFFTAFLKVELPYITFAAPCKSTSADVTVPTSLIIIEPSIFLFPPPAILKRLTLCTVEANLVAVVNSLL